MSITLCADCFTPKDESNTYKCGKYYQARCKSCQSVRAKQRYASKTKEENRIAVIKRYGLAKEQYDRMLYTQEHRCKICSQDLGSDPCIDHSAETGKVRGILCRRCNLGLGHFRDNTEWLRSAITYLEGQGEIRTADNKDEVAFNV